MVADASRHHETSLDDVSVAGLCKEIGAFLLLILVFGGLVRYACRKKQDVPRSRRHRPDWDSQDAGSAARQETSRSPPSRACSDARSAAGQDISRVPSRHTCSDGRRAMDLPPSPPNPESGPRKTLRRSGSHPTHVGDTPPKPWGNLSLSQSGSHGYLPSANCPSSPPLQSPVVGPVIPLRTASSMHEGSASSNKRQQHAPAGSAPGSTLMLKRASRKPEKLTISSGSLFYSHVVAQQASPVSQSRQNDDVPARTGSMHRTVSMPGLSAENDEAINDKGKKSVQVSSGSRFYSDLFLRRNVAPPTPVPGTPMAMTPPRAQEVPATPGAWGEVAKGPGHEIEASTPPTQIPHAKATTPDNDAKVRAAARAAILAQKEADDLEAAFKRAKQVAERAAARVELCASGCLISRSKTD